MAKGYRWIIPLLIGGFWIFWIIFLLSKGEYFDLVFSNNSLTAYQGVAQFGDAFGGISSLMATIAAIAVYYSHISQGEESRLQYFERNFFSLLSGFRQIAGEIDLVVKEYKDDPEIPELLRHLFGETKAEVKGREAIRALVAMLRSDLHPDDFSDSKIVYRIYSGLFNRYVDDLGHYFRSLYHVYRLIEEKCPEERKMYYGRIVRAQLSNSELCLLAYNCIIGEGRFEFVNYACKYSIFHNIHRVDLSEIERSELRFFTRTLHQDCFKFDEITPFSYDDITNYG